MTRATQKKCLIIIPQNWEKREFVEPNWPRIVNIIEPDKFTKNKRLRFYMITNMPDNIRH